MSTVPMHIFLFKDNNQTDNGGVQVGVESLNEDMDQNILVPKGK